MAKISYMNVSDVHKQDRAIEARMYAKVALHSAAAFISLDDLHNLWQWCITIALAMHDDHLVSDISLNDPTQYELIYDQFLHYARLSVA